MRVSAPSIRSFWEEATSNIPYRLLLNTFSAYGILLVALVLTIQAIV